jgi:hypothetical protein
MLGLIKDARKANRGLVELHICDCLLHHVCDSARKNWFAHMILLDLILKLLFNKYRANLSCFEI